MTPPLRGSASVPTGSSIWSSVSTCSTSSRSAFVRGAIEDVAQFVAHQAVFDIITRQSPQFVHLRPASASTWTQRIERSLRVTSSRIRAASAQEMALEGACPERVIIVATPRPGAGG